MNTISMKLQADELIRLALQEDISSEDVTTNSVMKEAVEGAGIFPLIGTDKYILMYDVYMKGKYQFTESTDLENFKVIDHAVSMDFHPRHGTVIPITEKELKRLYKVYGKPTGL